MDMPMKALPLLTTLHGLMKYLDKGYCYPSQEKLLDLMKKKTGIDISRRTLNRWLRVVENHGLIVRKRRIKHDVRLGMLFKSTMYTITILGMWLLKRIGVGASEVFRGSEKRTNNDTKSNHKRSNMNGGHKRKDTPMTQLKHILAQL